VAAVRGRFGADVGIWFIGLNVTGIWWQWRRLRVGSELDAGRYSEGRPEFGVNVAPVAALDVSVRP
jgi:hypothetical protein